MSGAIGVGWWHEVVHAIFDRDLLCPRAVDRSFRWKEHCGMGPASQGRTLRGEERGTPFTLQGERLGDFEGDDGEL